MNNQANKIFLSYSRVDAKFALKLGEDLRVAGLDIWIDQLNIPPGETWDEEIQKALENAACLLVILSATSVESDNVLNEINYALETKKQVIPILLENGLKKPFNINRLQHIDFTSSYDSGLNRLLNALRSGRPVQPTVKEQRRLNLPAVLGTGALVLIVTLVIMLLRPATVEPSKEKISDEEKISKPVADIAGKWKTGTIENEFDNNDKYLIEFTFDNTDLLTGTALQKSLPGYKGYVSELNLAELKIIDSVITFFTEHQQINAATNSFKNNYRGILTGDSIRFTLSSTRSDFTPKKFVAKRSGPE